MFDLKFNGKTGKENLVLVVSRPFIPTSELICDEYVVPGMDGVVTSAVERYEMRDITVDLNFMVKDAEKFEDRYRMIKSWLKGGGELSFSDDVDWFYRVQRVTLSDFERESKRIGRFTAYFRSDPYMYLYHGQEEKDIATASYNPYETCKPIYHVSSLSDWSFTVNGFTFSGHGQTYIDTEKMIAYTPARQIVNSSTVGDFESLYLHTGQNTITTSYTVTVIPRWRCL